MNDRFYILGIEPRGSSGSHVSWGAALIARGDMGWSSLRAGIT
jgi:hypothetical protein